MKLKKNIKNISAINKEILKRSPDDKDEQVLFDNFYIIEKITKTLFKEDKSIELTVNEYNEPVVGVVILNICNNADMPKTDELIKAFTLLNKETYISNAQYEHIIWAFRYTVLIEIYKAITKQDCRYALSELLVLLTKSDTIDTNKINEYCNPVELILKKDSAGIYEKMNFKTKQLYRDRISSIAKKTNTEESKLALKYISESSDKHVGEIIFAEYKKIFKKINDKKYILIILITSAVLTVLTTIFLKSFLLWYLVFLPIVEIIKTITDFIINSKHETTYLPRLELNNKIPDSARTLIVISTLITSTSDIIKLKSKLITIYNSNPFDNVKILALCDLKENKLPFAPEDRILIRNSLRTIKKMNEKYNDKFSIIIRKRTFSKTQNIFTGSERKRGAVEALIKFIKEGKENFSCFEGNKEFIRKSKYILTLDSDTKPHMDTVPELVSIALHPLNTPIIKDDIITKGYGIIVPKITTTLNSSLYSPFTKLVGGIGSSCAYDTHSSETYQDNFSQSIYSGKGLIDVDCYYKLCSKYFDTEKILSHDIIEGELLRTAFAGDIEFNESFPKSAYSYYKRHSRWVRGDIQNSCYLYNKLNLKGQKIKNPLGLLSRCKIADNIRRALNPIAIFKIFIASLFITSYKANTLIAIALVSVFLPFAVSFCVSVLYNGFVSIVRKYYSDNISSTTEIISKGMFSFLLLPQTAFFSLVAVIKAYYRRLISHKKLLEWTTASQTDKLSGGIKAFLSVYCLPFFSGLIFLFGTSRFLKLIGLIYLFSPIIVAYLNIPYKYKKPFIVQKKKNEIESQLSAMIQFYDDYAGKADNWLPPDNVQFAPVYRVCHRTSPTNIGLMMISYLVARDFNIIDTVSMSRKIDRVLSSVEKLEKYEGHLYNWYETQTLSVCDNPYVSSVDSGNFLCCLVALNEGLKEYRSESEKIKELIKRTENIINGCDIGFFYDDCKELLSIGYNPQTKEFSPNHYDLLMSESRMTSYYAVAKRQVPKIHWRQLGRTLGRNGLYSGPVAYTGTMFEYFMPDLFLESERGSLSYEGLRYCLYCQKQMAKKLKIPYGASESGFYSFDTLLNYQYKAHGVSSCGLKQGLDKETVISPYSTYLTLEYDFNEAFDNLERLKSYGMYGNFGFYEAVDFTPERCSSGGSIIKSYMAHHIGMSILSISNALQNKRTKRRFMRNELMSSAKELLSEKIMTGNVVLEDIYRKPETQRLEPTENGDTLFEKIIPTQPDVKLLYNGEYTLCVANSGICIAIYQEKEIYLKTTDILRKPEGCYFALKTDKEILNFSYMPEYKTNKDMSVEFSNSTVQFYTENNEISAGMKISLHNSMPCEIRQFAFKNNTSKPKTVLLEGFIQPVLCTYEEYSAHPAFCKLFLKEIFDYENKVIIASRRNRDNDEQMYCAIGFVEDIEVFCNLSREEILKSITGMTGIFKNSDNIIQGYNSIPDPAVFLRTTIELKPKEKKELTLFIIAGLNENDVRESFLRLRHDTYIYTLASSVVPSHSIEGRLVNSIIPQILFKRFDCKEITDNILKNTLGVNSLWSLGISGDFPIIIVNINNINTKERIIGYMKCHRLLHLCSVNFDLVYIYKGYTDDGKNINDLFMSYLDECNSRELFKKRAGIHLIDITDISENIIILLKAIAVHIAPQSMVRILAPEKEYKPIDINPVMKVKTSVKDRLCLGGFDNSTYIIDTETQTPWCNILANPSFGTLVSDKSLGFTYAINSRENKLTPWDNDSISDNRGEMLIIKCNDKYYDLVWGATAVFSPYKAIYKGQTELFSSSVTVEVAQKAMTKKISVNIHWHYKPQDISIAYYTEPALGVNKENSRMNVFSFSNSQLSIKNPLNTLVKGYMTITSINKCNTCITDKNEFLSGRWKESIVSPNNFSCGSIIINERLKHGESKNYEFFLSFGKSLFSSKKMHTFFSPSENKNKNSIKLLTPDKNLNNIFNTWLNWQALGGRIYARTGFSQNSGAWGFRDQLQDACGCLLLNSEIAKRQIARACTAQFEEGDVAHWWHFLPGNIMKGVRTRYSDDLVWLPYAVCEYINKTNDINILALNIAYCKGVALEANQHEVYGELHKSEKIHSVYNHCKRALEKAYRLGSHELILIGGGDWNDSFNRVGIEGKGESVWLSQFMAIVLERFALIANDVGDLATKHECEDRSQALKEAVEANCWDGEWYIRAYLDNGDELGSKNSDACQIDSLVQSFAVLSKLSDHERNEIALSSAYEYLVDNKRGLIKLFTPAFENNEMPVGYATCYPHGIRENGGQYTHGVIWLAIAYLENKNCNTGYGLIKLLNPAEKYNDDKTALVFKKEPYFMTADIYTNPQCYGRGGWSIYTGAAGWYYRAIAEWLIGIKINKGTITFSPCLPDAWNEFEIDIDYSGTTMHVSVLRGNKACIYDNDLETESICLDGKQHEIRVIVI